MTNTNRSILVCVTGGIAAYKVCDVVSKLVQGGHRVNVAMTAEAQQFVGATTFQALTGTAVATTLWHPSDANPIPHINLAQQADLILVAPATANILAKMAHGIADELVSTLLLAGDPKRIVVAPAMNAAMWGHPATVHNCTLLRQWGITFIGPDSGYQACGTIGPGRMVEPRDILEAVQKQLAQGKSDNTVV